jgi:hypothetical protein
MPMTNKPKAIGTAAETAVVRYLRDNGFPMCERRALHGTTDLGDVTGIPGLVIEVKAGEAAHKASPRQIKAWLDETETERLNAKADIGLLVTARSRQNVRNWWCVMTMRTNQKLMGYDIDREPLASLPCYLTLESAAILLRKAGWGEPLKD